MPLEKTTAQLGCLTCHKMHFSPVNDADLLRLTNSVAVCVDCHQQSDTTTPAAHLAATNSATLWPGGRYGSLLPARTNPSDRGSCANCHAIHGWPNATNTVVHYPKLLADQEENLCFTCHGTNGPAVKQVQLDFAKAVHHPVLDSQQAAGRPVECVNCHNAHMAQIGGHVYTTPATAARNLISNPLRGVSGVAVDYTSLTNFAAPTP
ncbi:MAG: cytochrome c3 family protein [Verrucomicrobia bacterium]|nr:cytochrome c3 family protein [Verrucomicrobiota bacterium]